ncbi:MAG: hypothetical protein ACOX3L_10460 [Lutisporaceae bacterium]
MNSMPMRWVLRLRLLKAINTGGHRFFLFRLTKIAATKPDAVLVWGFYSEGCFDIKTG